MFNTIFIQPIFNLLVFLYQNIAFQDLGFAIILLTIIIRFILFPLFYKSFKNQTILQKIQPEIKDIQQLHKNNREEQAKAMLDLYRHHKVNPFSSFFLLLVQLPILIALYQVFLDGLTNETLMNLYNFLLPPENLNNSFLNLIDLTKSSIIIVALAAIFQYWHGRLTLPKTIAGQAENEAVKISKKMVVLGPIISVVILYSLPSAVGLYWLTTSIFSIVQQYYINRLVYGTNQISNQTTN